MTVPFLSLVVRPWFDPRAPQDRRLLFLGPHDGVVEADAASLGQVRREHPDTLVISHPGEERNGFRWLLYGETARRMGEALAGSAIRTLALILGRPEKGALLTLAKSLGATPLETLVVAWYFTGDDISDSTGIEHELAEIVRSRRLKRLSLLTNAWKLDAALAALLSSDETLTDFAVCAKDDAKTWPRSPSPQLDALVARNRAVLSRRRLAEAPPERGRRQIPCGACGRGLTQLLLSSVEGPGGRRALVDGSAFDVVCEHCGACATHEYPLLYIDRSNRLMVFLCPPEGANAEERAAHLAEWQRRLSEWARWRADAAASRCRVATSRGHAEETIKALESGVHDGVLSLLRGILQEGFPNQDVVFQGVEENVDHGKELMFAGFRGTGDIVQSGNVPWVQYEQLEASVGAKLDAALERSHETWPHVDPAGDFVLGVLR